MESKFDYLTLTLKPENSSVRLDMALNTLKHTMLLGDLMHKMTLKEIGRASCRERVCQYV